MQINAINSHFNDLFYPKDKNEIEIAINQYISEEVIENIEIDEKIIGLIVPHAGWIYSGKTAGKAFSTIRNKDYELVVIIGPSHRYYFNSISVSRDEKYLNPVKDFEIDSEASEYLNSILSIKSNTKAFENEHSIEVELPFINKVLPNAKILPVIIGDVSIKQCEKLAFGLTGLYEQYKGKMLVIVSTDLSHYHNKTIASILDTKLKDSVLSGDSKKLINCLFRSECEACGMYPLLTLMMYYETFERNNTIITYTDDSSTTSKDENSVVGYLSGVMTSSKDYQKLNTTNLYSHFCIN